MHKLFRQRFISALGLFLIFSATVHMLLLIVYAIQNKNIHHLNYFGILELDRYIPGIVQGQYSTLIATVCGIAIFAVIYLLVKRRSTHHV